MALVVANGSANGTLGPPPNPIPQLPPSFLGVPMVDLLGGALIGAGLVVAISVGGWWRLIGAPVAALGVILLVLAWAVTPIYGG